MARACAAARKIPVTRAMARTIEDVMDTSFEPINWGLGEIKWFRRAEGERARTLEARASNQARGIYEWLDAASGRRGMVRRRPLRPRRSVRRAVSERGARQRHRAGRVLASSANGSSAPMQRPSVAKSAKAAAAVVTSMTRRCTRRIESGVFKREYRDHRLEWMIRSGGLDVVLEGIEKGNIRFSNELR